MVCFCCCLVGFSFVIVMFILFFCWFDVLTISWVNCKNVLLYGCFVFVLFIYFWVDLGLFLFFAVWGAFVV